MSVIGIKSSLKDLLFSFEQSISDMDTRCDYYYASHGSVSKTVSEFDGRLIAVEKRYASINEVVLTGAAKSVEMCGCGCNRCMEGYYRKYPGFKIHQCIEIDLATIATCGEASSSGSGSASISIDITGSTSSSSSISYSSSSTSYSSSSTSVSASSASSSASSASGGWSTATY